MRRLKWAIVAGASLWVVSLPLAAYAASSQKTSMAYAFALAMYGAGSFLCHQRPERSFHLWMTAFPVCARCAGIYVGGAFGAVTAFRHAPALRRPVFIVMAAALPSLATLVYEWTTGAVPDNWIRALAGFPIGVATGVILLSALGSMSHDAGGSEQIR